MQQRQNTIYKVARSIVNFQREFLDHGIEHLRPLVLRDVANDIGMHESTVSRVVTNKYMHTPQGVFEMKYFFHSGISSSYGESVSSVTIKQRIKKIIEIGGPAQAAVGLEDRQHPAARGPRARAPHDREVPRGAEDPDLESAQGPLLARAGAVGARKAPMRLVLTGRHVDITPGLRRLVDGKLARLERLLGDAIVSAQVVLTREKDRHVADVTLHVRGDHMLNGRAAGATWSSALAGAVGEDPEPGEEGERQVGASASGRAPARPPSAPRRRVPRRRARTARASSALTRTQFKPMSLENATLELAASGEAFLLFRNVETDGLSVLLRAAGRRVRPRRAGAAERAHGPCRTPPAVAVGALLQPALDAA